MKIISYSSTRSNTVKLKRQIHISYIDYENNFLFFYKVHYRNKHNTWFRYPEEGRRSLIDTSRILRNWRRIQPYKNDPNCCAMAMGFMSNWPIKGFHAVGKMRRAFPLCESID